MKRRTYTAREKLQVVLESLQRDTTIETVRRKYGLSNSVIQRWRTEFFKRAEDVFADKRSPKSKALASGYEPGQSPDELKKIIGEYATQLEILKKAEGLLGAK